MKDPIRQGYFIILYFSSLDEEVRDVIETYERKIYMEILYIYRRIYILTEILERKQYSYLEKLSRGII